MAVPFARSDDEFEKGRVRPEGKVFKELKGLKDSEKWVVEWWSFELESVEVAVCLKEFPSYGQSNYEVEIWRKGASGKFESVWKFRSVGIGPVRVNIDKNVGRLEVHSTIIKDPTSSLLGLYLMKSIKD